MSRTLCKPLKVALIVSTVCSLILSAMTLANCPSVMNLTPCSTPLHVAMICSLASSARARAELLADKKEARARRRESRGRERIVCDKRALRERYGLRAACDSEVNEVVRDPGARGVGCRNIFFG